MKNYVLTLKLLIKNMFKRDKTSKNSKYVIIAYCMLGVFYLFITASLIAMVAFMTPIYKSEGLLSEFICMLLAVSCLGVLLFGLVAVLNALYFSKDTEFFLTLPVKPSTVYFAKLTVVYLTELVLSMLILIPSLITIGVMAELGAQYYIIMFFGSFIVPLLPLLLASILAIPLMYIVSFFKNRAVLSSVVLVLLFGAFFGGYYFLLANSMSGEGDMIDIEKVAEAMKAGMIVVSKVLLPLTALAKGATLTPVWGMGVGASTLVNILIFVGFLAVLGFLAFLISSAVYRRGVASQLETAPKTNNIKGEYKASGTLKALIKKEWRELIRTPAFAFQCLSGVVLCPIIVVFLGFTVTTSINQGVSDVPEISEQFLRAAAHYIPWLINIGMVTMIGVSMNVGAATCITREGTTFALSKCLPVDYRVCVKSKTLLYTLISSVTVILSLSLGLVGSVDFVMLLLGLGFALIYNYGFVCFAIFFDLHKPKLNWVSPNEAVKNNQSANIPAFINMGMGLLVLGIEFLSFIILASVNMILALAVSFVILYAVAITVAVVFHNLLRANAARFYSRIGV